MKVLWLTPRRLRSSVSIHEILIGQFTFFSGKIQNTSQFDTHMWNIFFWEYNFDYFAKVPEDMHYCNTYWGHCAWYRWYRNEYDIVGAHSSVGKAVSLNSSLTLQSSSLASPMNSTFTIYPALGHFNHHCFCKSLKSLPNWFLCFWPCTILSTRLTGELKYW